MMSKFTKITQLEDLIKDRLVGDLLEQEVESLLPPGENYGSIMYKVDFKIKNDNEIKVYNAVAKCTPTNPYTQELFNTQDSFKSEIAWYTTVIPTLKKFAQEEGLKRELNFFQEFYGSRISLDPNSTRVDLDGVILTGNLKYRGFFNIDRHQGFDHLTTLSVLKDLATFHAVPMALRLKNKKLFDENILPYCPSLGNVHKDMADQLIIDIMEHIPGISSSIKDRCLNRIKSSIAFGKREIKEPWITVMHLDFWCNNIMITGGENSKNMILDLQVPMVGSPAGDVLFFLLTSVNFDIVQNRFDEYLRFYYDQLMKNLQELNVDRSERSWTSFIDEVNKAAKNAEFSHTLSHNAFILMDKGVSPMDSSDENFKSGDLKKEKFIPNAQQIAKYSWIIKESLTRNWI